ncbi:Glycosyltransferase [Quillaja saponaria]|uniref:Glycosyltransferase n=1 Tax=Quillaja saponaria TaxID=32244 RepID=A0AAD7VFN1_QUISA|nr:Glycosyltransferase [Quillaja saponaria]
MSIKLSYPSLKAIPFKPSLWISSALNLSVTSQLSIPVYYFFTSFLYFPTIHNTTTKSLKELNTTLNIPGVPPMPSSDMPKPLLERTDKAYEYLLNSSLLAPKTAGAIINTFEFWNQKPLKQFPMAYVCRIVHHHPFIVLVL